MLHWRARSWRCTADAPSASSALSSSLQRRSPRTTTSTCPTCCRASTSCPKTRMIASSAPCSRPACTSAYARPSPRARLGRPGPAGLGHHLQDQGEPVRAASLVERHPHRCHQVCGVGHSSPKQTLGRSQPGAVSAVNKRRVLMVPTRHLESGPRGSSEHPLLKVDELR